MPLGLLLLATVLAVALSVPMTRVKLTGYGKPYTGEFVQSDGLRSWTLPPRDMRPADLNSIAAGTGSVQALKGLIEDAVDRPIEFVQTREPATEIMVCTVEPSGDVSTFYTWGFPIVFAFIREGRDFDSIAELSQPVQGWFGNDWDTDPMLTTLMIQSADQRSWRILHLWHATIFGVLGFVVLGSVAICRVFRRQRSRVAGITLLLLGLASTGLIKSRSDIYTFTNGGSPTMYPTGLMVEDLAVVIGDEGSTRELAGRLRAALPDDVSEDRVVYLGFRTPTQISIYDTSIGPTYVYFGNLSVNKAVAVDTEGVPSSGAPVRMGKLPFVRMANQSPMFAVTRGDTRYTFHAHTGNLLAVLVLVALSYFIPGWVFAFVASRRHKKRLRLGWCCGCGYELASTPAEVDRLGS